VINADDFYGRNAFETAAKFLTTQCDEKNYAIVGYDLTTTLSDYGTVNRGVCTLDANGDLSSITERINIAKKGNEIHCEDGLLPATLSTDTKVSMNFWCFHPSFFNYTEQQFVNFLAQNGQELKSEFFIPLVADSFIKSGGMVKIVPTTAHWFGVTYKEDAPFVEKSLQELITKGEYPRALWA
jgi:hypothetical protein